MRGATNQQGASLHCQKISIHAPHAGRDGSPPAGCSRPRYFNPRAPCGARQGKIVGTVVHNNFNPRAPCGARPRPQHSVRESLTFQSTRPMRGATEDRSQYQYHNEFQSTRPMRGATEDVLLEIRPVFISIHAPHAGRDLYGIFPQEGHSDFNPRAPCGARLVLAIAMADMMIFQSTRPMRGATGETVSQQGGKRFQSTRPMRGATVIGMPPQFTDRFQSTRPMRGATNTAASR